jgi:hypothetical protein
LHTQRHGVTNGEFRKRPQTQNTGNVEQLNRLMVQFKLTT